jgi:hypothetical protein
MGNNYEVREDVKIELCQDGGAKGKFRLKELSGVQSTDLRGGFGRQTSGPSLEYLT